VGLGLGVGWTRGKQLSTHLRVEIDATLVRLQSSQSPKATSG
jgi:hypothetical protein